MPLKAGKSLTTETTTRASKGKSSFKFSLFLKKMELNITRRIIDVNSNIIFGKRSKIEKNNKFSSYFSTFFL